ncbi:hypothetical protein [Paenibacillus maysiensis]|uniref:hypothetical protein n=1 Tax=Paenibacillus maysiensis TaxID=1155954 RepID=UPI0004B62B04|nr:hypothetical protein [Paenibacillus maysiensis]
MTEAEKRHHTRDSYTEMIGLGYGPKEVLNALEEDENADAQMVNELRNAIEYGL